MSELPLPIAPIASQAVQRSSGNNARREHNRRLFRGALDKRKAKPPETHETPPSEPDESAPRDSPRPASDATSRIDILA